MEDEIDPYEKQLLAVFKSCDSNGNGVLDKNSFNKLCDALQLEDSHRSLLTTRLCDNGKCSVVFSQFRDALLVVLASLKSPADDVNSPDAVGYENAEEQASPKCVFGGKKYGRRSRPSSTDQEDEKSDECHTPINDDAFSPTDFLGSYEFNEKSSSKNTIMDNDFEIDELCKHLGVHKDTTIAKEELISVCSSLGITNSVYDMIRDKISKVEGYDVGIDIDDQAKLTYGQFFQLIKNLGSSTDFPSVISNSTITKTAPFSEDGISSVDINASGCISYDTLVYLFENAGISDAGIFLNDLGISPQFDVNLAELAGQLQEELLNVQRCMDDSSNQLYTLLNPHLLLLQASVVVSQAQIKWYKSYMEQMQCERDKLRNDLLIANERASLLAQEVDDNHARMENSVQQKLKSLEQKHAEQIKKLTYQWSQEREQLTNQNLKMEKQLEQLLYDETKLRSEVVSLKQDYENLEKENRNLLDQLVNAENTRDELEREIQRLSLLKKKVLELETSNEQAISFLEKMNQLQAENIMLRDKNDELAVELENVTLRHMQSRSACSKRRGNSPLEGEENSDTDGAIATHRMFSKVRKYSTEKDLSIGYEGSSSENFNIPLMAHCESGIEADISTSSSSLDRFGEAAAEANEKLIAELKSRVAFLENFIKKYQLKVPDSGEMDINDKMFDRATGNLEKQCETLQQRLDQVQKEILKILSEKRACSEENCALKKKISELMKRLPDSDSTEHVKFDISIHSSLETIKPEMWSPPTATENMKSSLSDQEKQILDDSEALKFVENEYRTAGEHLKEFDSSTLSSTATQTVDTSGSSVFATVSEEESEMEWKTINDEPKANNSVSSESGASTKSLQNYDKLIEDYNRLAKENKSLTEKCEELGGCLDMLRNEYDQCEEYWASKLDEERRLYEEEQRISDEKFAELRIKIEEYSEMFDSESMAPQMVSKLPPIAENDKLEKEVNDLQEEFKTYKEKMELENKEKQKEIDRLLRIVSAYEAASMLKPSTSQSIEQSLESIKSDKTYVLDGPSVNIQDILQAEAPVGKSKSSKLVELKMRKKQLKKDCNQLERERGELLDHIMRMRSESRMPYNFTPCGYVLQQHNAEVSKNGILLRLRHQEMKNRHLRNILLQQQKKLNKTMREMLERHEKELDKYRSALSSSQDMWQSLQERTKKQAEQIAMSDVLVKELYCENSQLMATIHQLEQQHLDCPSPVLL